MTAALCLNIIFIHYASDLTAKMTAEPQIPSIRSFEDVERLGYEVAMLYGFGDMPHKVLRSAPNGSAMQRFYDDNRIIVAESREELSKLIQSDSKTLAFYYVGTLGKNVIHMDIAEAIFGFICLLHFKKALSFLPSSPITFLKFKKWESKQESQIGTQEIKNMG